MSNETLFRQASLERLSSPERLDTLLEVTTPRAWIALAALVAILAAAIIWGVFGTVPDTIAGRGLLVRKAGLLNVESGAAGVVRDLHVSVGDEVAPGQTIGRLFQADVEDGIRQARERLAELERNRELTKGRIARDTELAQATITQQRQQAQQTLDASRARIRVLEGRVAANHELLKAGLISEQVYDDSVQQLAEARQSLASGESQLRDLTARESSLVTQAGESVFSLESAVGDARRQIETMETLLKETGTIRSPAAGRVVEILTEDGAVVTRGQPLVTIEKSNAPLMGVAFVGSAAKQIRRGMLVKMSPAGVAWEEHGYMMGRVASVSDSPLSPTAMNVLFRNEALVHDLTAGGAAYAIGVELERDPSTPSGFRWTSRTGPDLSFGSGTMFDARVSLEEQRPIELVIPSLRRWLGF